MWNVSQFTVRSDDKFSSLSGEFPTTDGNNYRLSENSGKAGPGFGAQDYIFYLSYLFN